MEIKLSTTQWFCLVLLHLYWNQYMPIWNISRMWRWLVYGHISMIILTWLGGLFITTLLLVILYKVPQLKIASFSDKYSYEIYIVHQLFILSPLTLMALTNYLVVNIVVTLLSIGISGIVLKTMTKRLQKTIKNA